MGVEHIASWLRAFVLTQCVEMGVYVNAPPAPRPLGERLAIAFGASAITHPLVWFVIPDVVRAIEPVGHWKTDWWIAIAVGEAFAVSCEALWLVAFGSAARRALAWSFFANVASFTFGLFVYEHGGW